MCLKKWTSYFQQYSRAEGVDIHNICYGVGYFFDGNSHALLSHHSCRTL